MQHSLGVQITAVELRCTCSMDGKYSYGIIVDKLNEKREQLGYRDLMGG